MGLRKYIVTLYFGFCLLAGWYITAGWFMDWTALRILSYRRMFCGGLSSHPAINACNSLPVSTFYNTILYEHGILNDNWAAVYLRSAKLLKHHEYSLWLQSTFLVREDIKTCNSLHIWLFDLALGWCCCEGDFLLRAWTCHMPPE